MLEMIGRRRRKSEETKLKISKANKGKGLGRVLTLFDKDNKIGV